MGMIEDFIARYTKEYDFYDQAGRVTARLLEKYLLEEGIRAIVTSRAKSVSRLQDKCLQREKKNGTYVSVEKIFEDIKDLAGVRVALYFPGERSQVEGIVKRAFHATDPRTKFESTQNGSYSRRFTGYSAAHYTIQLKDQDLSDQEKRYATARIEVQIASVLMHAWSEVEHDLVYKPLNGDLSHEEHAALDQLNGLVLAGEMALESLQKAQQTRVARKGKKIATHYDLAVHLLGRAESLTDGPIKETGLGRVDLLFDLISKLNIDTAESLSPYLKALHGNLELRPLSEQIIDALLAEDPARYETYSSVRARRNPPQRETDLEDVDIEYQVGAFMSRWIALESLIGRVAPADGRYPSVTSLRLLRRLELLDQSTLEQLDRLRRMRNNLVHGIETPSAAALAEAAQSIDGIRNEIIKRYGDPDPRT
jgi:ppGpp synthetase/RelA/SpoT-type nucleotidyltranferase